MSKVKIYIHTDLEGISGIDSDNMVDRNGTRYRESCELLMADVNAAVDGALAGGADHVTVLDSHGGGGNFIPELLDSRAELDTKPNRKWWAMMDGSYSGTYFIGAHAMAGTLDGFLDHTQSSGSWYDYSINGRSMGELAQWAIVAGNWGIPLLMVSGDQAACIEAKAFFNPIETAVVKQGIGRNRAELIEPEEARSRIREAAGHAVKLIGIARPFVLPKPMEVVLRFYRSDFCDSAARNPAVERLDARTIRKITDDPLGILPW